MAEKIRISLKSLSRVDQGSWARATSSLQSPELPSQETLSHCVYMCVYMRVRSRRFRQHAHKSLLLSSGSAQPPSSPLRSLFDMRTSLIFSYYQEGNVVFPRLLVLTFCRMPSPGSASLSHLTLPSPPVISHFSSHKADFSLEFQLLLPALDCLLPIAKVILIVIQLKSLYFLMDTFFLPQGPSLLQASSHPSRPPRPPPPTKPDFQGLLAS